jgi:hypothetical protein
LLTVLEAESLRSDSPIDCGIPWDKVVFTAGVHIKERKYGEAGARV